MFNIAVVTCMKARSERFPGKNMHNFLGKPLYLHTVEFAKMLGYPYYLISDTNFNIVGVNCVNMHAAIPVNEKILALNLNVDFYVLLQVTSPLRDVNSVLWAIREFRESNKLCACSVRTIKSKYIYDNSNKPINFKIENRTYDGACRDMVCYETGSLFMFRKCQLEKNHIMNASPNEIMLFEDSYNVDIDTYSDIETVERKMDND